MKSILVISTMLLMCSCSQPTIMDQWEMFEVSIGIGPQFIYQDSISMKTIVFFDNGDVHVDNGDWCEVGSNEGENIGNFNVDNGQISTICNSNEIIRSYFITEDTLTLQYPSIEPTYERYKRK